MSDKDRGLELKVGIFVAIGLLIVGALVVEFGRFGEGLKTYYLITVHFSDASGLLKSSDVLLGGAKIGRVAGPPRLVSGGRGVDVPLKIYHFVNIPVKSTFTIGSSGLLGDRFVSIYPPAGKPSAYIAHGARVEGAREGHFRPDERKRCPDQGIAGNARQGRRRRDQAERSGALEGKHGSSPSDL
jgi:phospholipid/cholesterol/gamma-HCH transport system substrate-binding protein